MSEQQHNPPQGAQRHSIQHLEEWLKLEYGMFIHFGMFTFDTAETGMPSPTYAPERVDADQWIQVARDAGMTYAVLTTKSEIGHCSWPSRFTDYHVGTSSNKTDVVEAFVKACEKHGLMAGLYYCCMDFHHCFRRDSAKGADADLAPNQDQEHVTDKYFQFQQSQIEELLTQYGPIGEVWMDIPIVLGAERRKQQYDQTARLQPDTIIVMNNGRTNGTRFLPDKAWPSDVMTMERHLPYGWRGYDPWFHDNNPPRSIRELLAMCVPLSVHGQDYYVPGEVCDTIGYEWAYVDSDPPRKIRELLAMRVICKERGANLLLDVPPDPTGSIPRMHVDALMRLRKAYESVKV